MKILILNGSHRPNGNSAGFTEEFRRYAQEKGHEVNLLNIGQMKINGCLACEYCHTRGNGECVQNDDMSKVYPYLSGNDLIVFASPVHYWSFSSQMQAVITRLYNRVKIECPKFALILSSASQDVYDAPISQYKSIIDYFDGEDAGILTFAGNDQANEENFDKIRKMIDNL